MFLQYLPKPALLQRRPRTNAEHNDSSSAGCPPGLRRQPQRSKFFRAKRILLTFVVIVVCWPLFSAFIQAHRRHHASANELRGKMRKHTTHTSNDQPQNRRVLTRPTKTRAGQEMGTVDIAGRSILDRVFPPQQERGLDATFDLLSTPRGPSYIDGEFPPYSEYARLVEEAALLPEVVHIPFAEAVAEMELPLWGPQWISEGIYDAEIWGNFSEPKIDWVYTWVNGSELEFRETKRWYEENSTLNDPKGLWLARHGENRYRDWDELRYSIRSVEANAPFRNKYFILSNAIRENSTGRLRRMSPSWLNASPESMDNVHVLVQEDYFEQDKKGCTPAFNSLTVENQMYNIESDVDPIFGMSDDMILGKPHAASDIWSPLFGPMMGFKTNAYSTTSHPTEADAKRFGEKPWLIYTSWLLNRRFGVRKRKGQAHFGHSITRSVSREAMKTFPGPELQSACSRFRGDFQFQLYLWYATFHYTIERHREALLWSYFTVRADANGDGMLSWDERQVVIGELADGLEKAGPTGSARFRSYYHVPDILESAGLEAPKVNTEILWTSLDGPVMIRDLECFEFDLDECLAPGFSWDDGATNITKNPVFSTTVIFDRLSRQNVKCGDCFIKILLNRVERGLEPMLPLATTHASEREIVIKSLLKYQYSVMNPDALFIMVTDAEQVETAVLKRLVGKNKAVGQLCLNDDVQLDDEGQLRDLQNVMTEVYTKLFPQRSRYEITPRKL